MNVSVCKCVSKHWFSGLWEPQDIGGGGFTPLQAVAGTGYVAHFLKYFRSPHEDAGKSMRIVLAWTQFQTGLPFPILSWPSTDISYVNGRYFHFVMHHLKEIGGTITHIPAYILPALRDHDRSLMETAIQSGIFNTNQLKQINCVRIYLGSTYLSKVCRPKGKTISREILHQQPSKHYQTQLTLPHQPQTNS